MVNETILDTLRFLNILMAVLSVIPTIPIARQLIKERKNCSDSMRSLNRFLTATFITIATGAFISAFLSVVSVLGTIDKNGDVWQFSVNLRNTIINFVFFTVTWGFYKFMREK